MTKQETENYIKIGLAIIAVIVILAILGKLGKGVDSFLESVGLKKTEEEKKTDKDIQKEEGKLDNPQPASGAGWQPSDFNVTAPVQSIKNLSDWINTQRTMRKAVTMNKWKPKTFAGNAKKIYDSVGVISDKPNQGLSAIKDFTTKNGVAHLVNDFRLIYDRDMLSWLKDKYDTENQKKVYEEILSYINNLPVGVISTTTKRVIQ